MQVEAKASVHGGKGGSALAHEHASQSAGCRLDPVKLDRNPLAELGELPFLDIKAERAVDQLMAEIVDALLASRHQPPFRPHQQSSDEQCCQHRGTHPPAARHAGRFDYVELVAQREAPNGQRYRQVEAEQQPDAGIFGEQGDHAFDDDVGLAPGQANDVE